MKVRGNMFSFAEFRTILKYRPRIKEAAVAENLENPQTVSIEELRKMFSLSDGGGDAEDMATDENKTIEIRLDPLLGKYSLYTTLICEERAKRPRMIEHQDGQPSDNRPCDFCEPRIYSETAVPKIYHSRWQAMTFPNFFPYLLPHFVTVLTNKHKPKAEDLTKADIAAFIYTGKEIAHKLYREEKAVNGMWDLINWGASAGGSQPHPHAQRGGLSGIIRNTMDKETEIVVYRQKELGGEDPFEYYLKLVNGSPLQVEENEVVSVFAPYAPRFTDQIDIITKTKMGKNILNYLELEDRDIDLAAMAITRVILGLAAKRGMTEFNLVTHQARFYDDSRSYRLHWHLYPRKSLQGENSIGGMELNDMYVVSAYPEDTAMALTAYPADPVSSPPP